MEVRRYAEILLRRKWVVILTLIASLAGVGMGVAWMTPTYSSSATVRIAEGRGGTVSYTELNYAERLLNTYVHLLRSRPFLENVIQRLNLRVRGEELSQMVRVESLANTELIKVTVEATSPSEAATIANTLATLLVQEGQKVYAGSGKSATQILAEELSVIDRRLREDRATLAEMLRARMLPPAETPIRPLETDPAIAEVTARIRFHEETYGVLLTEYDRARVEEARRGSSISVAEAALEPSLPVRPRPDLYFAVALLVGLVGGVGLAFMFEGLDPAIHTANQLEWLAKLPMLGEIPILRSRTGRGAGVRLIDGAAEPSEVAAFRILGANALSMVAATHGRDGKRARSLLVTSAEPRAGRSTVLVNLAITMAKSGQRVVVVDADLRGACLHRVLDLPDGKGLLNVLGTPREAAALLQDTSVSGLRVLASGVSLDGPIPFLDPAKARELLNSLANEADVLLVDGPPVLASSDASVLAPSVDGVIFVAARNQTAGKDIDLAVTQLQRAGARTLGGVLNRAAGRLSIAECYSPRKKPEATTLAKLQERKLYFWAKRWVDITLSALALALMFPLLLLIALLIKLDSAGPVVFAQERMGYDWRRGEQRTFAMYKFRTMYHNCDQTAHRQFIQRWIQEKQGASDHGGLVKLNGDPRVTRVGRVMRKTSLDEIPQLWNVMKGDMSLVGPRPVPLYEVAEYDSWHMQRLQATPGITCLWQVYGRGQTSIDEMVQLDLEYIEQQSLLLDFKLLLRTIPVILSGRGAA